MAATMWAGQIFMENHLINSLRSNLNGNIKLNNFYISALISLLLLLDISI